MKTLTVFGSVALISSAFIACSGGLNEKTKEKDVTQPSPDGSDGSDGSSADDQTPPDNSKIPKVTSDKVDLSKYKGFALTDDSKGAGLIDPDVSVSTDQPTTEGQVSANGNDQSDSNLYGIDEQGNGEAILFPGQKIKFRKIFATPKALFLFPGGAVSIPEGDDCNTVVLVKETSKFVCVTDYTIWGDPRTMHPPVQYSLDGTYVGIEVATKSQGFGGYSQIARFDFSDPNDVKYGLVYERNGYPEQWRMNAAGDIAVQFAAEGPRGLEIIRTSGPNIDLGVAEYVRCLTEGVGAQVNEFTFLYTDQENIFKQIAKNESDQYTVTDAYTVQASDNLGFMFWGCDALYAQESVHYYAMRLPDADSGSAGPDENYSGYVHIVEYKLDTKAAKRFDVPGMRSVRKIYRKEGDSPLIVVGDDTEGFGVIVTLDPTTGTVTPVVTKKQFRFVDSFVASDRISLTAVRESDKAFLKLNITNFAAETDPEVVVIKVHGAVQMVPFY